MTGLYLIVHRPSGRVYVGSSVDVQRRLRAHRAMLARGQHDNVWLQRTWDRDGASVFGFSPLAACSADDLRDAEAQCVALFPREKLFNLSDVVRKGARASNAALSDADVRSILKRAKKGEAAADISEAFGTTIWTIRRIIAGETYLHITHGKRARPQKRARGARHGNAKLSEAEARAILARKGQDARIVAREHGITLAYVYMIWRRDAWKHL